MSRVPVPKFQLPPSEGVSAWAFGLSVVTNLGLLSILVWLGAQFTPTDQLTNFELPAPDYTTQESLAGRDGE